LTLRPVIEAAVEQVRSEAPDICQEIQA